MGVYLKLENMMKEVVKSSWLVTLNFMKSMNISNYSPELPIYLVLYYSVCL